MPLAAFPARHSPFALPASASPSSARGALGVATVLVAAIGLDAFACWPARAAVQNALIANERFSTVMVFAPIVIAVALVAMVCWRERGRLVATVDEPEAELAPETMPSSFDVFAAAPRAANDDRA